MDRIVEEEPAVEVECRVLCRVLWSSSVQLSLGQCSRRIYCTLGIGNRAVQTISFVSVDGDGLKGLCRGQPSCSMMYFPGISATHLLIVLGLL